MTDWNNSLVLGDCRTVMQQIPDNTVSACITDPPYNYEFIGHKWDTTEVKRRTARVQRSTTLVKNIPYGSGLAGGVRNQLWYNRVNSNIQAYQKWCREWGAELFRICKPGASVAVFSSTRTLAHVQVALEAAGFYMRDCLVYRRPSGIPRGLNLGEHLKKRQHPDAAQWQGWHSCLRNEWEAIVLLQKPLVNNYLETFLAYETGLFYAKQGQAGFHSNIIEGISRSADDKKHGKLHCTVKPLALMEHLIKLLVPLSGEHIVIDPFAGAGTTLVAAQNLGVNYIGIEIAEEYYRVAQERLGEQQQPPLTVELSPLTYTLPLFPSEMLEDQPL